jgi:hypothetical protein
LNGPTDEAPRGVAGLIGVVELAATLAATAWVIRARARPLEPAPIA